MRCRAAAIFRAVLVVSAGLMALCGDRAALAGGCHSYERPRVTLTFRLDRDDQLLIATMSSLPSNTHFAPVPCTDDATSASRGVTVASASAVIAFDPTRLTSPSRRALLPASDACPLDARCKGLDRPPRV